MKKLVTIVLLALLTTSLKSPTSALSPTPAPTPAPYLPETISRINAYDYLGNSTTGLSKDRLPMQDLKKKIQKYGSLHGIGMPFGLYQNTMEYIWEDCTDYTNKPIELSIDLTETLDYDSYVGILKRLSRYDGVYLYKIGESFEGRDIYAIEIDLLSDKKKRVIMFTGQVHAREFAGGTFLVKQFVDLIQKAQTDSSVMTLLEANKYVAVPIINVDGRQALIHEPKKWTSKSGELLKAYTNGVDGNRNFPSLMWGQVSKGNKLKWSVARKPGLANYPGDYAGASSETRALMKWIYHYTIVEQAAVLIDMHQQGSKIYAGKRWTLKEQEELSENLRKKMFQLMNKGNTARKYGMIEDEPKHGLEGTGSTVTDFAASLACGAKFSPAMGHLAFTDGKREYMLVEVDDLDKVKFKVEAPNPEFVTLTVEIGIGPDYLGNSSATRKLLAAEYRNYHFDNLLEKLPNMLK